MALRIAVDAANFRADRRGMGRSARATLRDLLDCRDCAVFLIARTPGELREDLATKAAGILTPSEARRRDFDVAWYPWNGMRFVLPAPALVSIHDTFAFSEAHRNPVARYREQQPIRRAARLAQTIVTSSAWSAGQIVRTLRADAGRIVVVHHKVESFWSEAEPRPAADAIPYVVFVAGPERRKNAAFLCSAFARAFPSGVKLVVAGTLAQRDRELFARLPPGCLAHVFPSDEELRALYRGAWAVTVPSLAEGYGLPAIEAMACGAPVIASNAAALPETCGNAALLLPPGDREGWVAALRSVVRDRALQHELRVRGRERIRELRAENPAQQFFELLQRCATARRPIRAAAR